MLCTSLQNVNYRYTKRNAIRSHQFHIMLTAGRWEFRRIGIYFSQLAVDMIWNDDLKTAKNLQLYYARLPSQTSNVI